MEGRSLHNVLRSEKYISVLKKKKSNDRIFSLAWNIVYCLLKGHVLNFSEVENAVFYGPKS